MKNSDDPDTLTIFEARNSKFQDYVALARPKQFTKNLLVFAALIFTNSFTETVPVVLSLLAFAAMCLLSASGYVLNDLLDAPKDRLHPKKRHRPIAAGTVSQTEAQVFAAVLLAGALALGILLGGDALLWLGLYAGIYLAYNFAFKAVAVADVFAISLGFVVRAALGAAAIDVTISGWLLLCTGALALTLGFGKRRSEFMSMGEQRGESRPSLLEYTLPSLDALLLLSAGGAVLSYGVYSIESATAARYPALVVTTLFVAYGVFRYVFLVLAQGEGAEPETMLVEDRHILASVLLFCLATVIALNTHIPLPWGER